MTTLVRNFIPGVQHLLQDRNPPFRRWPEKDVVRAINFGVLAIYKYLPRVSTRTFSMLLQPGSDQYIAEVYALNSGHLRVMAFVRALSNMGTNGLTRGRAIRPPVDRDAKDAFDPGWQTELGTEVREVVFDKNRPTSFAVSPSMIGDRWIEIEAMVMPTPIQDGGPPGAEIYQEYSANPFVLPLADNWVEDLLHYVVAYLLMTGSKATQNLPMAQTHAQAFMSSINAQAQVQSGVNPNLKSLPFTEDMK